MLRIARRALLVSLFVLSACAPYRSPFEGVMHCPDYPTPELQLQCQQMVLGLYQSGQNAMFSNWSKATHVEPIYSEPMPVYQSPFKSQAPVSCNYVGTMLFCN